MAEERWAPIFFTPFVSSVMRVEPEWIDESGRLPNGWYQLLFDRAAEEAFSAVGLGGDLAGAARATSPLPAQVYIHYKRDLRAGDPARVTLQLVDHDDEQLHLYLEMRHAEEGWIAAACELLVVHVGLATRRAEPFPTDILHNLTAMKAAHARLGRPDAARGAIAIPRRAEPRGPLRAAGTRH